MSDVLADGAVQQAPQPAQPEGEAAAAPPAQEGKRKKGGGIWRVVFWLSMTVCLVALGVLGHIGWSYYSASKGYQDIAEKAFEPPVEQASEEAEPAPLTLGDMDVDWDYLRSVNGDVVGWIYIPGTVVNYPVVQTDNNDYYLHTDFNGATGSAARVGTIFVDFANKGDFSDTNTVIYGHHMNDGSMFACLSKQLTNNDEFNAHRTVFLLTPTMNYKLTTFSLVLTTGTDLLVETAFENAELKANYIRDKEERSVVQPAEGMPDPKSIDKLITLSTCDYSQSNGRAVMFCYVADKAAPHTAGSDVVDEGDMAIVADAAATAA